MSDIVKLEISDEIVRPIVEKSIQQAIVRNMGNVEEAMERMVSLALKQKVDNEGKLPKYSSDARYYWLDIIFQKTIQDVSKDAFVKWLNSKRDMIEKLILKEMMKKEFQAKIAKSLVGILEKTIEQKWYVKHEVKFEIGKEY